MTYDGMAARIRAAASATGQRIKPLGSLGVTRATTLWNAAHTRYAGLLVGPSTVPTTSNRLPGYLSLPAGMYLWTTPSYAIRVDPAWTIRRDPLWTLPIVGFLFRPGMTAAEEQKVLHNLSIGLGGIR